jgi:hypothetical protein
LMILIKWFCLIFCFSRYPDSQRRKATPTESAGVAFVVVFPVEACGRYFGRIAGKPLKAPQACVRIRPEATIICYTRMPRRHAWPFHHGKRALWCQPARN